MATLYDAALAAGIEIASHESDLYLPDTPEVRKLVKQFEEAGQRCRPSRFMNQRTKTPWLEFAFCYMPYWRAREEEARRRLALKEPKNLNRLTEEDRV